MKNKTIEATIAFRTNEFTDTPHKVVLEFSEERILKILECKALIKKHKLDAIKIDMYIEQMLDEEGEEIDWRADVSQLIINDYGIYLYAQHKFDAADQIESENLLELLDLQDTVIPTNGTKVLITVEGGIVQSVCANENIEYVVVDYDDQSDEPAIVGTISKPDVVIEKEAMFFNELYKGKIHPSEKIAKKQLKKLNF